VPLFRVGRKYWMDRQPKRMSSAGVLLEDRTGHLLIVKANYKDYWTIPGGVIDENETPRQAAVREVAEEIGLTIKADDLSFSSVIDRISDSAQTYQFIFMLKTPVENKAFTLQQSEIDEVAFVSRAQVASGHRRYAKAVQAWANHASGYVEHRFDRNKEGL
jgi:8-oxo-dGTP diphosphatase